MYNLARGFLDESGALAWSQLRRLAGLFIPAALFVGLIPFIGMYVSSGAYMLGVLLLQNRRSLLASITVAISTPLALYVVFERMFQVSLPRGAFAGSLGF